MNPFPDHHPFAPLRRAWRTPGLVPGFELINILGSGGQGIVFKARRISVGRTYAVKFLYPTDIPGSCMTNELRHLDVLADLHHPHLVPIHDVGEAIGFPYIVMDDAGDRTLRDVMSDRTHTLAECIRPLDETADGLSYLHARGILHLDLKPTNVFIRDGHASLGDFDLSRVQESSCSLLLTRPVGTLSYVAPEVVSRGWASTAADVYALGRILAEVVDLRPGSALTQRLRSLMARAICERPDGRPTLDELRGCLAPAQLAGSARSDPIAPETMRWLLGRRRHDADA